MRAVNPLRHSLCCCAETIGTATITERAKEQDLSTGRGGAVHAPSLCICDLTTLLSGIFVVCAYEARRLYVCNA